MFSDDPCLKAEPKSELVLLDTFTDKELSSSIDLPILKWVGWTVFGSLSFLVDKVGTKMPNRKVVPQSEMIPAIPMSLLYPSLLGTSGVFVSLLRC